MTSSGARNGPEYFQHDPSNVVVRRDAVGEGELPVENKVRRFGCRFAATLSPHLVHFRGAELNLLPIAQLVKTVGCEQNAVSGGQLHDVPLVSGAANIPEGNPPSPNCRHVVPEINNGCGMPALEKMSSRVATLKRAYKVEQNLPQMGRCAMRSFSRSRTSAVSVPVL